MPEEIGRDKVANEASDNAIKKAHIPEEIRKSYSVSMEFGRAILDKKIQRNRLATGHS